MSTATPAELSLTAFLTLDGVTQAPGGPTEDTSDGFRHGGWVVPHFDDDLGVAMTGFFSKASAFLLGRRTYDIFAAHWPKVTDPADPVAAALNGLPKHVASRTLDRFTWSGTSPVRDVAREVAALKQSLSGELQVHGSSDLAQTLIAHDLIDEYRLLVFPVVLGSGRRLFGSGTVPATLRLQSSAATPRGVLVSVYRRAGQLATGDVILKDDGTYEMVSEGPRPAAA
jgi:dihydrofolate reductase